jgi:RNA polymerase sigma-70 factor, ECF subfamily
LKIDVNSSTGIRQNFVDRVAATCSACAFRGVEMSVSGPKKNVMLASPHGSMMSDGLLEMTFLNEDARKKIEDLFLRFGPGVARYALLRVGSPELAEEITARVFLSVVRNFAQQNGSLVGWLWAIVRTELSRHYRERPHQGYPDHLPGTTAPPMEQLERKEREGLLHAALKSLDDEQQQLVSLKFFLGLSNLEIAEATGLTPSNVGVKLHRTLKDLRRLLQKTLSIDLTIATKAM